MYNTKRNLSVGFVVLAAIGILVYGIPFLKNSRSGEKVYFEVLFPQISNLSVGDPVKLNGVTMGRVEEMHLWQHQVKVQFHLQAYYKGADGKRHPIRVPKNSEVTVQNIGLMGERQIDITLGNSSEFYAPGDLIKNGYFDAGIAEAMGAAGRLFEDSRRMVQDIQNAVDSTVGHPDFAIAFNEMLLQSQEMVQQLKQAADEMEPEVKSSLKHLNSITTELNSLVESQKGTVAKTINQAATVAENLQHLVTDVQNGKGALGMALSDSIFAKNLQSVVRQADSLLVVIRTKGLDVNVDIF
jgi:phospholipid/cholesterol/gamma-HCH transport system substrate-binding protein